MSPRAQGTLISAGVVAAVIALVVLAVAMARPLALIAMYEKPAPRQVVKCQRPAELEQLHIVVVVNGDKIEAECMYIGARGTYRRSVR